MTFKDALSQQIAAIDAACVNTMRMRDHFTEMQKGSANDAKKALIKAAADLRFILNTLAEEQAHARAPRNLVNAGA